MNTIEFNNVYIQTTFTLVGPKEYKGPLRPYFHAHFDDIYLNFKTDMEKIYLRYCSQRDEVLRSIQCDCASQEQKRCLKEIEKEAKEKYKDFKEELEEQLCKNQKNGFRKFQRE